MKKRSKVEWEIGDVFGVVLVDGSIVVGQIVGREPRVLNSVSCAFFDIRLSDESAVETAKKLTFEKTFSVLFVTRDLLDDGTWRIFGRSGIDIPREKLPHESLRASGFVGSKVYGSRNVTEFLNAFFRLIPWDDWHNPNYLDAMLISPEKKPQRLLFKSRGAPRF